MDTAINSDEDNEFCCFTVCSVCLRSHSSAERFLGGTLLLAAQVLCIMVVRLCLQAIRYCVPLHNPPSNDFTFDWFIYCSYSLLLSVGILCWLKLFRNLWGQKAINKYPINEYIVVYSVATVLLQLIKIVGLLVLVPPVALWKACVFLIETCQGGLCEKESVREGDHGVEVVNVEKGKRLVRSDHNDFGRKNGCKTT